MNIFDVRENLDTIVFDHDQQIKDLAAQLLELKQSTAMFKPGMSVTQGDVTPMMEFKRREWVGLTAEDINQFETWFDDEEERKGWVDPALIAKYFEAKLREKNS